MNRRAAVTSTTPSGPGAAAPLDPRAARTRAALKGALAANLLSPGGAPLTPKGLAAAAGIGRSTFYAHFSSADAVFEAALAEVMAPFARALLGQAPRDALEAALSHFWEHRKMATTLLTGRRGRLVAQSLQTALETSLRSGRGSPRPLAPAATRRVAAHLSGGALTLLGLWLSGRADATVSEMAVLLAAATGGAAQAMADPAGVSARV